MMKRKPALPENASIRISLSGLKRRVIWDALYGARAADRNSGKPDWYQAREELMDSMKIIPQYRNRIVVSPALPDNLSIEIRLSGLKRKVIWDALYGARAKGRNDDKPDWYRAREEIMEAMRRI